jgi:glycosyltransferase involved in cell wall biosynthesis
MRLVFVTQRIDPDDPVLGATVAKVRALAARCDEVVVLAGGAVPGALPDNCRVRLFDSPTRIGRGLRFGRALAAELGRSRRPAAVVAHMCPIYAVLAAPLVKPRRVRLVLWFTHWKRSRTLAAAVRVSDAVTSVDVRSVPLESAKVRAIGHGIDVAQFACADGEAADGSLRAIALGRYSAAKGLEWIVRAVGIARSRGLDVRLRCHGTAGTAAEEADRRALETLVSELGLEDAVVLGGPVPRADVPAALRHADLLVNNMRAGATDKAVFEACASCLPVVVSNPPFEQLVGDVEPRLLFAREDAADLAGRLEAVGALTPEQRHAIGTTLRARVEERHSVDSWAEAMIAVCRGER